MADVLAIARNRSYRRRLVELADADGEPLLRQWARRAVGLWDRGLPVQLACLDEAGHVAECECPAQNHHYFAHGLAIVLDVNHTDELYGPDTHRYD